MAAARIAPSRFGLQSISSITGSGLRGAAGLAASPRQGWYPPFAPPARLDDNPPPALAHRRIEVFTRPSSRSQLRRVRRADDWIPGFLQGRGRTPDVLLRVPIAPVTKDYNAGLFVLQARGKIKMCGPLYELVVRHDPEAPGAVDIPDQPLRVHPVGMLVHPVTDRPLGLKFVARPPNEPVRVRVPVRFINTEKCPGLRVGGWINQLRRCVDIAVAPGVQPPLCATQDLADVPIKGRRTVGQLEFDGKGQGCRTVLPDDDATTIISVV